MAGKQGSEIHKDHRKRMQQRFERNGFDGFAEHEVLEFLLYFAIPRGDVNPLAHALIDRFGSFADVLEADAEDLMTVEGIGPASARLITSIMEAARYYQLARARKPQQFRSLDEIGDYLKNYFYGSRNEQLYALFLDDRNSFIAVKKMAEGSVNATAVSKAELVRQAVRLSATQVVLAHNHPRGVALPSAEDVWLTQQLRQMLNSVGVALSDHIIYDAAGDWTSMAQSGRMNSRKLEAQPAQEGTNG